jgi:uncharacterized membrane protein YfcA
LTLTLVQYLLGIGSGALVGFVLGLVGGGGSILAVPLMVYLVGVKSPHMAIGTSAFAVAANAATGLVHHARAGHVKWRFAAVFAVAGVAGAALGSTLGKAFDGQKLLFLFALLMIVVGILMLRRKGRGGNSDVTLDPGNAANLAALGLSAGVFSGFFGIGGGFLIVPGLIAATDMPMIYAVGSSLVAVTAFGLTTAINYSLSGLVDWALAFAFIGGGLIGSLAGTQLAGRLSEERGRLAIVFSALIFIVAAYMLWKSAAAAWG